MQDIKLIAWDENQKRILPVADVLFKDGEIIKHRVLGESDWRSNNPMTYIGVHDLEDKEIYTGFIVQHKKRPDLTGVVRFAKGSFFAIGRAKDNDHEEVWGGLFMERNCVVIGNCYQNPDLMPKTKQNVEKG